jgi:hypothetical protein
MHYQRIQSSIAISRRNNVFYFQDLSPWTRFGETANQLIAIGWLDQSHPFTQATQANIDPAIIAKLQQLPKQAPVSIAFLSINECPYCRETASDTSFVIPGDGFLYVYPSLLLHYIQAHGYAPPAAFCEAVLNCPPLDSPEYVEAVRQNCTPALFRSIYNKLSSS